MNDRPKETTLVFPLGARVQGTYAEYVAAFLKKFRGIQPMRILYRPFSPIVPEEEEMKADQGLAIVDANTLSDDLRNLKEGDSTSVAQISRPGCVWDDAYHPMRVSKEFLFHYEKNLSSREFRERVFGSISRVLMLTQSGNAGPAPKRTDPIKREGRLVIFDLGPEPSARDEEIILEYLQRVIQPLTGTEHVVMPVGKKSEKPGAPARHMICIPSYAIQRPGPVQRGKDVTKDKKKQITEGIVISGLAGYLPPDELKDFHVDSRFSSLDPVMGYAALREAAVVKGLDDALKVMRGNLQE